MRCPRRALAFALLAVCGCAPSGIVVWDAAAHRKVAYVPSVSVRGDYREMAIGQPATGTVFFTVQSRSGALPVVRKRRLGERFGIVAEWSLPVSYFWPEALCASPDGTCLAYYENRADRADHAADVCVVELRDDGAAVERRRFRDVTDEKYGGHKRLIWLDDKTLAGCCNVGNRWLSFVADVATGERKPLATPDGGSLNVRAADLRRKRVIADAGGGYLWACRSDGRVEPLPIALMDSRSVFVDPVDSRIVLVCDERADVYDCAGRFVESFRPPEGRKFGWLYFGDGVFAVRQKEAGMFETFLDVYDARRKKTLPSPKLPFDPKGSAEYLVGPNGWVFVNY